MIRPKNLVIYDNLKKKYILLKIFMQKLKLKIILKNINLLKEILKLMKIIAI